MIKHLGLIRYYFRRGKLRRQNIVLNENLKDLTSAQIFEKQIDAHRQRFQSAMPQQTLSQTLKQQNPKLNHRFKVDRQQLQKKIKKTIMKQLKVQRIVPAADDQTFETIQSKSHIHNQQAEIQFEQKFREQLFKKKQTNRLIEKQKNDYRNYLEEPKNIKLKEYQQNLKKFKNNKIDSMMNFKKNNQQLRMLIDSGYIDNPLNLGIVIDKINSTPKLEHQTTNNNNNPSKNYQQYNNLNQRSQNNNTNQSQQLVSVGKQLKQINSQTQQMHNKMMENIKGPSQLRNPSLLQKFMETLQQSNHLQKEKAKNDLQLMKKIKQFQDTTFQNRYNTLNFRFKGQVNFDWMKQSQLLSYIKTQKNINTQPLGLLTIYMQNCNKQNKFKLPIITPTVMSRIYSVCSLYKFPQTDLNNRINMLNDKKFIQLEKNLFKNIHQLNDQSFADAVFAYCRNHKQEQGLLKQKMSQRIVQTMWTQLNQRINYMEQQDLGLVLRSIIHTSMLKNESFDWTNIIEVLGQRLPLMQKDYEFESVMSFIALIPPTQYSINVVHQNIDKFKDYKWQSKETLQSFLQISSFLILYKDIYSPFKGQKLIQQLKHAFCMKYEEIMAVTDQISINTMPQLLSLIYYFQKSKQIQAKYEIEVPNKLINKCKKQIVDSIRMQKQLLNKQTVGNIALSMSMIDYCKALTPLQQARQNQLPVLQVSLQKSLFSFRPIPFNSINYFTYHEMMRMVNSQIVHLPVKSIAQTLFAASLVRYKNQGIFQEIMQKTVQKIYFDIKKQEQDEKSAHLKYTRQYMLFVCTFHHSRMANKYYYHFVELLMQNSVSALVKVEPNLLLRFFQSIVSISFTTDQKYPQDYQITKYFSKVFDICYEQNIKPYLQSFKKQQLLVLQYITSLIQFFNVKNNQTKQNLFRNLFNKKSEQISSQLQKCNTKLTLQGKYLQSMTNLVKRMIKKLQNTNQNQIQQKSLMNKDFQFIQSQYYRLSINKIMDQQQQIGSQFKYETIYQNIRKKLIKQNRQIKPKTWRIQIPQKQQVYFICTYQHLFAKYQDDTTSVRLFGFWKVYSQYYALKQWNFKFICTFLEG